MRDSLTSPLRTVLYSARPPIRVSEILARPCSVHGANRTAARTALDSHVAAWKRFHSSCCCGVSSPAQPWAHDSLAPLIHICPDLNISRLAPRVSGGFAASCP